MKKKRLSISFFMRERPDESKKGIIYAKITYAKRPARVSTGIKVNRNDFKKGRIVSTKPRVRQIQKSLETFRDNIYSIYAELVSSNRVITIEDIISKYKKSIEVYYLLNETSDIIESKRGDISDSSIKTYNHQIVVLRRFFKDVYNQDDIPVSNFDEKVISDMQSYFLKKNYKNSSINHYSSLIQSTFKELIRQRKISYNPYINHKKLKYTPTRTALNLEEIEKIKNYKGKSKGSQFTADIFIFMCYTGTSISDTLALKKSDIYEYKGRFIIDFKRIKTNTPYVVPLFKEAKKRMDKYIDRDDEHIFPKRTNENIFQHLQDIKKELKITKKLSSHIARHTFATTICLDNGIDLKVLSTMLGHASVSTTEIYGKIQKDRILDDTAKLDL